MSLLPCLLTCVASCEKSAAVFIFVPPAGFEVFLFVTAIEQSDYDLPYYSFVVFIMLGAHSASLNFGFTYNIYKLFVVQMFLLSPFSPVTGTSVTY